MTVMALSKKKIYDITDHLENVQRECVDEVKKEVSESYHLKHFPDRGVLFRLLCEESPTCDGSSFEKIVQATCAAYIYRLRQCQKGRDKYIRLQLSWMDFINTLLQNPEQQPETADIYELVTRSSRQCILADDTVSAMIISITRSVYNVLQKQVVSFKETKSSEIDDDEQDPVAEALVFTDEASLHRMGGFALHSAIKSSSKSDMNFLTSLRLPKEEKNPYLQT